MLSCAPAESEVSLSFAGLADLLGDTFEEAAALLPAPQRRALRVALALEDSGGTTAEQRTISARSWRCCARWPTLTVVRISGGWQSPRCLIAT